jgi:putative redox protein
MAGIHARWIDGHQYVGLDETGHAVVTDDEGQGFKPSELLLVALVTCAGADVVRILNKKRQKPAAIEVKATKHSLPDPPFTIEKIEVEWTVRGRDLKEKAVSDAVHLAEEKYCSVKASLKSQVVTTVRVVNEEA